MEIGGLIVDERWRRRGIGRQLVHAVQGWAVERGAVELSVRCREERTESHTFYESLSFRYTKTQRVYRKRLVRPILAWTWTLDVGRWTLDVGRWTLDVGRWTLDVGRWTLDVERC